MKEYKENEQLANLISELNPYPNVKIKSFVTKLNNCAGKCIKCTGVWKKFANCDVIILVSEDFWNVASDLEKRALVEHELSHIDFTKSGKVKLKRHDIEEFLSIVQKYGAWDSTLKQLQQILKKEKSK